MDDSINYFGAIIFWLYIVAALGFTALVIHTILNISPTKDVDSKQLTRNTIVFSTLAAISFAILSVNMLNVLIQSFNSWSQRPSSQLQNGLLPAIWEWSLHSTLFRDFAKALVANSARYLWTEAALFVTFITSLFMGAEGFRRSVPRLWAFFCLSQILPISFTQNLFYLALLRLPDHASAALIDGDVLLTVTGIYCGVLLVIPRLTNDIWFRDFIFITRAVLLLPLRYGKVGKIGELKRESTIGSSVDGSRIQLYPVILMLACLLVQGYITLRDGFAPSEIFRAVFDHPAVSSLGCDGLLSAVSFAAWCAMRPALVNRLKED